MHTVFPALSKMGKWVCQTILCSVAYPLNMPIKIYLIVTLQHKIYPNTTKCGLLAYIGLPHLPAKFHAQLINTSPGIGKEVTKSQDMNFVPKILLIPLC